MDLSPGWADYNVFLVGQALGRASKATGPSSRSSGIAAARRRRKPSCGEVGKLVRDLEMQ
jgi:hypothetical protein